MLAPPFTQNLTFFSLSLISWHIDGHYSTGSEALCNKALFCCMYAKSPEYVTRAAPFWGD
jgi:hypothetical protein